MSTLVDWLIEHEPSFSKNRLPSLYSDLAQQKAANPGGFAKNAADWQAALTRAALAAQLPTEQKIILQASDQLLDALSSRQYGRPSGLGLVLDEGIRNGKFMNLGDFSAAEHSVYQRSWIPGPFTILKWSLKQIGLLKHGGYDTDGRLRQGSLVLLEGLEQVSKQLVALQSRKGSAVTDRIMSRETFAEQVGQTEIGALSSSETEILLRYLSRDKEILSYDSNTVKFKSTSAEHPEPITQEDSSIASIKSLITSLESQVSALNTRISNLQATAKSAVETKNKNAALSALRSKKLAESDLQSRTETLYKLEEVYNKIEQAVDQVQVIQVMQASTATLKSLNKRIGGVENVDAIMDDLREQMSHVNDVGQVLQEPLRGDAAIDEAEVDDEFEAMEKEETAKKEELKAEATKVKLAELENLEAARKQAEREREEIPVQKEAGTALLANKTALTNGSTAEQNGVEPEILSASQKLRQMQIRDLVQTSDDNGQYKETEQPMPA